MNTPSEKPQPIDPEAISAKIFEGHEALVRKTEALVAAVDAEYAFQAFVTYHLFKLADGYNEAEHGLIPALIELAAFHLYPRFGQGGSRDPGEIQAVIDALTEQNQFRSLATAFSVDRTDPELASLQVHLRLYAESVRGSSYSSQIRHRIEQIQGPFDRWFCVEAGIGPVRALEILDAFEKAANENFKDHKKRFYNFFAKVESLIKRQSNREQNTRLTEPTDLERVALGEEVARFMEELPLMLAPSFDQAMKFVAGLSREEWVALRELIGLTFESRQKIQHPRDVKDRPVYFLSGDRFIFVDISSAYDALFEAFDRITRTNLPFRDKRYVPNLSYWMEAEACDYLSRLFPPNAVYRQLTYPDPDNPGGETELDAAVMWGHFLVLVEVKGKQFRARSRLGDPSRLKDDLRDSIEEAFEQTQRATRFIVADSAATFVEKGTGRKLIVQQNSVHRIFPLSVTLHHFGGLATQLALLKKIGLFKDSAYPWSVALADLDVITRFAGNPDVFLHYAQRRLDLQRSEKNIMGEELDVFGLYLDTRLHPSQVWERKSEDGKAFTMLHLSGGSERFDEWFQAEQGVRDKRPDIGLKMPRNFSAIIDELRRRDDDGARWIAFALLGLSQAAVSKIEGDLDSLREHAKSGQRLLRITFNDSGLAVSILAAHGLAHDALRRQTEYCANFEKYRLKASASLALGVDTSDMTKPFEFAFWVEGPWKANPALDEALLKERPKAMPGQKLPGRNERCTCGSGKKFKRCCLGKITILPG